MHPTHAFDVGVASHDDLKAGVLVRTWSRVIVSAEEFPSAAMAADVAACMACTVHAGMATEVLLRL